MSINSYLDIIQKIQKEKIPVKSKKIDHFSKKPTEGNKQPRQKPKNNKNIVWLK